MAINVHWLDEKQDILIFRFSETFTMNDLRSADTISSDLTQDIEQPFHIIYNFSDIDDLTRLPSGLFNYLKERRVRSPHLEQIVVVIPKVGELLARSIVHIAKAIRRQYLQKVHVVGNQTEAIDLLHTILNKSKKT